MAYSIKAFSELTGVPKNTLVAWERRYRVLQPARLPNGYRRYGERELRTVRLLQRGMDAGLRISEAARLVRTPRPAGGHMVCVTFARCEEDAARRLVAKLERAGHQVSFLEGEDDRAD